MVYEILSLSAAEIIDDCDFVSPLYTCVNQVRSDETSPTSNKYFHTRYDRSKNKKERLTEEIFTHE
jgi:hypothetical protein